MKLRTDIDIRTDIDNRNDSGDLPEFFAPGENPQAFFQDQSRLDILEFLSQLVLPVDESQIENDFQNCQGVLLLGNKGIGKTSLIREFVDFYAEDLNINVALIDAEHYSNPNSRPSFERNHNPDSVPSPEPSGSDTALFSSILKSFGMSDYQCNTSEIFQKLFMDNARLSHECGRSVMVIIDNAHRLSSDVICELLFINDACYQKDIPVYWVFSSEPGLDRIFETLSQKHKALGVERAFPTLRLHALNLEDTERFINFSCEHAGISGGLNLQPSDIESIYNASQGNPGLIPNVIRRVLQNSNSSKSIIERIPRVHRLASVSVAMGVGFLIVVSALFDGIVGSGFFSSEADKHQAAAESTMPTKTEWFLDQNPQNYTIQLISGENMGNIDNYIREYNSRVGKNKLYKLKTIRDGKDWYLVFCGLFDDKASALAFGQQLPESMQINRPWVRSFQHVQQEIQNKISVSLVNQ